MRTEGIIEGQYSSDEGLDIEVGGSGDSSKRWLRKSMQLNNKGIKDVIARVN
jgi:hypothetical protein